MEGDFTKRYSLETLGRMRGNRPGIRCENAPLRPVDDDFWAKARVERSFSVGSVASGRHKRYCHHSGAVFADRGVVGAALPTYGFL